MAKKTTSTRSRSNTTRRTAGGAQQYDRELSPSGASERTSLRVSRAMADDLVNLSSAEFRQKYNMSFTEARNRLKAADAARNSENIRRISGRENSTTQMYDEMERREQSRSRGYAKGGMVKSNCGASTKPNRKAKK